MAGRRLLDAAKLFNVSRSVAKHHWKLRSAQYDVWSRTSSLAKLVKDQTDRVTLTAQAAAALARRFNEPPPSYTSYNKTDYEHRKASDSTPNQEGLTTEPKRGNVKEGIVQDHHWEKSQENTTRNEPAQDELDITQEEAQRHPLPDGTIPPEDAQLRGQPQGKDTFNKRPTPEPPKDPLAEQDAAPSTPEENLEPISSGKSTIPTPLKSSPLSPAEARRLQRQSEDHIPAFTTESPRHSTKDQELEQGHDRDVFYSRSTAVEPDYSSLPRVKLPKHGEQKQGSDIPNPKINADVFHNRSGVESGPDDVPEGIDTAVFRTPRVARMLGGRTHGESGPQKLGPQIPERNKVESTTVKKEQEDEMRAFASDLAQDSQAVQESTPESSETKQPYVLRESKVPSTRFGRLWQYGGLATSMAFGAVGESFRRITGSGTDGGSLMLSPGNIERLVAKLSRMRGAALKLGQMISIQDMKMLPAPIHEVLSRVQDSADYMPASQRDKVLSANLGSEWRSLFKEFQDVPIAAASIGQVHRATLASNGKEVAVKVQYPGVADSIDSDLNNLSILLTASRLLPKGLYLDKTIANARTELAWECDYVREAECQARFQSLLADDTKTYSVPTVYEEACGPQVLTAELMHGTAVTKHPSLNQSQKDWVGTQILRLCLREIVEFKFMQTDPNWTNFLYNSQSQKLELLDFGASREYPDKFVDPYVNILISASKGDRQTVTDLSIELGYLTGNESATMRNAHVDSVMTLSEPFSASGPEVYDFRDQTITDRVRSLIPVMVRERLSPPPEETYSLHRKLSGAFLLCARLGSRVPCRELFENAVQIYKRGEEVHL